MQSPKMSFVEATANTVITFAFSWAFQIVVLRPFGIVISGTQAFWITSASTLAGFLRAYLLRRWFTTWDHSKQRRIYICLNCNQVMRRMNNETEM